jgi:hypothetical protein
MTGDSEDTPKRSSCGQTALQPNRAAASAFRGGGNSRDKGGKRWLFVGVLLKERKAADLAEQV